MGALALLIAGFYVLNAYIYSEKQAPTATDYQDAAYLIEGQWVPLEDGIATDETGDNGPETVTKYFGNELWTDLDGDGSDDVAFILTQERVDGSVLYYGAAALSTKQGYLGTEAYPLGDRIAPQPTTVSPNPRHTRVIVFNFADRAPGADMSTAPSIGKSVYLKLVPESRQWAIVEPDFEGESR